MKNNINLLFIGGAKRVSLLKRFEVAAKRLNKNISFYSYELDSQVPISNFAIIILGKKWKDNNIYSHILEVVTKFDIDIIIPNVDPAIEILAKLKNKLSNSFVLVSDEKICSIFFNKQKAHEWFLKNKIPTPQFDGKYPMIAKPNFGSASEGIVILKNEQEYFNFNTKVKQDDFLIQRYIDSTEYTVDCYVNTSKTFIGCVPRIRIKTLGGESTESIIELNKRIMNVSKQILSRSNLTGPVTIQFLIEKKTNKIYAMEVNPRLGGGVILSIEAGLNIPYYIICDALLIKYDKNINIKNGLIMKRYFEEVFFETNN